MNAANDVLIRLDGVTKVFYTDEVETHALSGVHMDIKDIHENRNAGRRLAFEIKLRRRNDFFDGADAAIFDH